MLDKAREDESLEQIKAELKQFGDARHLRIQAIYERQFEAAGRMLQAQGALQPVLSAMLVLVRGADHPITSEGARDPSWILERLEEILQRAESAFAGQEVAINQELLWLDKETQQAVVAFDQTVFQIGTTLHPGVFHTEAPAERLLKLRELLERSRKDFDTARNAIRGMVDPED
jgi:hypothetical protein